MSLHLAGYPFGGPIPLLRYAPPHAAGVFAILSRRYSPSSFRRGLPFDVLFVAESSDLPALRFPAAHTHFRRWVASVGCDGLLHIAIHYMLGSTAEERAAVTSQVIAVCNPTWRGQGLAPMPATLDAAN